MFQVYSKVIQLHIFIHILFQIFFHYRLLFVTQMCPTLCDPKDCCPTGSSVHGISSKNTGVRLPFPSPGEESYQPRD